ncbi:hypothetical protein [Nocardia concava]|uniref:hypothetical protein n=1 Tax=Nocardia concava TaxID=257281 RepID=UPI000A00C447|nr:hypothetical protein [Nocardia concava]
MGSDPNATLRDYAVADMLEMEQNLRLSDRCFGAIRRAGYATYFVPIRWNGSAGSFAAYVDRTMQLAETCASTAWCASLFAAHGRLAGYFPEDGQRDLWGGDAHPLIAAAVVPPSGKAERVSGGWTLDGSWRYVSGIHGADWVLVSSQPSDGEPWIFAVPRSQFKIVEGWHPLGLRATGSHGVAVIGGFVPDHRAMPLSSLLNSRSDSSRCHQVPYRMVTGLQFAAPLLGAARAVLRSWTAQAVNRGIVTNEAGAILSNASVEIRSAELLIMDAARRADCGDVTPISVAESQRDAAHAAHLCARAVDSLFRYNGISGQHDDQLQRRWRDVLTASGHRALRIENATQAYLGAHADLARRVNAS